ncbi:MAG: hypothetical protein ACREYF_22525 [Gammaproteobacteria bacterium]
MDEIGLADALLDLPYTKIHDFTLRTKQSAVKMVDFAQLTKDALSLYHAHAAGEVPRIRHRTGAALSPF